MVGTTVTVKTLRVVYSFTYYLMCLLSMQPHHVCCIPNLIFATSPVLYQSRREKFPKQVRPNQCAPLQRFSWILKLCRRLSYYTLWRANNKGVDQTMRMHRLHCAFVVRKKQNQCFSWRGFNIRRTFMSLSSSWRLVVLYCDIARLTPVKTTGLNYIRRINCQSAIPVGVTLCRQNRHVDPYKIEACFRKSMGHY